MEHAIPLSVYTYANILWNCFLYPNSSWIQARCEASVRLELKCSWNWEWVFFGSQLWLFASHSAEISNPERGTWSQRAQSSMTGSTFPHLCVHIVSNGCTASWGTFLSRGNFSSVTCIFHPLLISASANYMETMAKIAIRNVKNHRAIKRFSKHPWYIVISYRTAPSFQ